MIEEENIEPVPGVKPGSFAAWCASFRPKTLGIAAAPVIVGLSVSAAVTHTFHISAVTFDASHQQHGK